LRDKLAESPQDSHHRGSGPPLTTFHRHGRPRTIERASESERERGGRERKREMERRKNRDVKNQNIVSTDRALSSDIYISLSLSRARVRDFTSGQNKVQ